MRTYLNADPQSLYDPETTMYDDREVTDGDNDQADQQVASLMNNMAGINDDDDAEEDTEAMEGSQFGGEVEG